MTFASRLKREETLQTAVRAQMLRAGVLVVWLLLIVGICVGVLLLR